MGIIRCWSAIRMARLGPGLCLFFFGPTTWSNVSHVSSEEVKRLWRCMKGERGNSDVYIYIIIYIYKWYDMIWYDMMRYIYILDMYAHTWYEFPWLLSDSAWVTRSKRVCFHPFQSSFCSNDFDFGKKGKRSWSRSPHPPVLAKCQKYSATGLKPGRSTIPQSTSGSETWES